MKAFRDAKVRVNVHEGAVFIILLISFSLLFWGCSHKDVPGSDESLQKSPPVRIAVIPFRQIFPEDLQKGAVESPLTGAIFDSAKSSGSPENRLERDFLGHLEKDRPDFPVVAGEQVAAVFRNVSSSSMKISLRQALCETGRQLGADMVLVGYLYRFRELQGESFSAEKPASVAFEIVMLQVTDGKVVWRGIFDRTQRSLMEDIFQALSFYQGKGRWLKADKLAAQGLDEVMKTFPAALAR